MIVDGALRIEDGYRIDSGAGFTDANGRSCTNLDVVEHGDRFAADPVPRRGILLDCTSDGDAYVLFRDTRAVEIVKWANLCRVPEADGPGARPERARPRSGPPEASVLEQSLAGLGSSATAAALCEAVVQQGYQRPKVQLAIQRAIEDGRIAVDKDWSLHPPANPPVAP